MKLTACIMFGLLLAAGVLLAGDDELYDPAEAARYRRDQKSVTSQLLEAATTQPASAGDANAATSRPASQPESPFVSTPQTRRDALPGYIELSNGTILPGTIFTTREKPWSLFEAESKSFRRIPPAIVRLIDAEVVWERDEPDWRWKEGGSDEKIYTGRTYPARMLRYTFTLVNGQKITGTVQQPIYVQPGQGQDPIQFILHERDKGPLDSKLSQLVYVRHVELGVEALARGRELAAKRAATQPAK